MIYRIKKLFNIAFENIAISGIIFVNFSSKFLEAINCPMSSFFNSTRIRIKNKGGVKNWIKYSKNGVM